MDNNIKKYILDCASDENHYLVINKETGKEVFKISKHLNNIDDVLKNFPELEIKEDQQVGRTRVTISDENSEIRYLDGKWIDKDGVEWVSDDEYYKAKHEKDQ